MWKYLALVISLDWQKKQNFKGYTKIVVMLSGVNFDYSNKSVTKLNIIKSIRFNCFYESKFVIPSI